MHDAEWFLERWSPFQYKKHTPGKGMILRLSLFHDWNPDTSFMLKRPEITVQSILCWLMHWCIPDSKVHGANMGPSWDLSAPAGPHVGPWTLLSGMFETRINFVVHVSQIRSYLHWYYIMPKALEADPQIITDNEATLWLGVKFTVRRFFGPAKFLIAQGSIVRK